MTRVPGVLVAVVLPAVLSALLAVASAPAAVADGPPSGACSPVALFVVPGSGETTPDADPDAPVGLLAGLTVPLATRHPGALDVAYLPYPASIERPPYPVSELRGVEALARTVAAHTLRCPGARVVLLGYSQGGDVVSDLVHRASRGTVAVDPARIAGAVMLGSPRRDPAAANLVDTPGRGVLGPRPTAELDVYGGRVYEVCAPGDPICASEDLDLTALREGLDSGAHRSYPTLAVAGEPLFELLGRALDDLVTAAATVPATPGPAA